MTKITLSLEDFKALASEARLDILRSLDSRHKSLKEISQATELHETTVHEHLLKLVQSGYVKKNERQGHKWVYYKLTWKGSTLLHPDNTRVVVLFCSTFTAFFFSVFGILNMVGQLPKLVVTSGNEQGTKVGLGGFGFGIIELVTVGCLLAFGVLIMLSIWMYKKNKKPKL